jgi:hypothetical protein
MAEQLRLFDPAKVNSYQFDPVNEIADAASSYMGGKWRAPNPQQQVDHQRGHAQALAYRDALEAPQSPTIESSYAAMREHVNKQYDYLTRPKEAGGMGFTAEFTDDDPYPNPSDMASDVRAGRIKAMKTATTGGHAYFSNEENDRFRAVHDVFGHAAIGRGFSRHGEEAAFLAHQQMFPKEAHEALVSETRGQNSWLNYSGTGDFPDQTKKLIGLPDWASQTGKLKIPSPKSRTGRRPPKQGTLDL